MIEGRSHSEKGSWLFKPRVFFSLNSFLWDCASGFVLSTLWYPQQRLDTFRVRNELRTELAMAHDALLLASRDGGCIVMSAAASTGRQLSLPFNGTSRSNGALNRNRPAAPCSVGSVRCLVQPADFRVGSRPRITHSPARAVGRCSNVKVLSDR
jgi:hypothetical protein